MKEIVKIFGLGGLDENGKNCIVIEINKDIFVVNMGAKFPDKTMPGIDYIISDYTYLRENKDRVRAYFLLHGHHDEIGGIPYVYPDVPAPIYCSAVTRKMVEKFTEMAGVPPRDYVFKVVDPSSVFKVNGREVTFFQTAHNIAHSSGVAIMTERGNVVVTSDFVVENNGNGNYRHDLNQISRIAKNPTLALLSESLYANRRGYTAPSYKLTPLIEQMVKDAPGRVFVSLFSSNSYNIEETIKLAIASRKKIVPYDLETAELLQDMQSIGQLMIPRGNFAPREDLNRLRDQDTLVLVVGNGSKLYSKIALLAAGQNETWKCYLRPSDTFIMAAPSNDNTEIEAVDALDELYRSGVHVRNISKRELVTMHASEEDLKMMIALLRPQHYLPVKGFFKDLLSNAEVAISMDIGLNHQNVLLLENGLSAIFDDRGGRIFDEKIPHGDLMIDGIAVGDVGRETLQDREKLAQGLAIVAVTVSKSRREIVAGPDVNLKGLVYFKDAETLSRDVGKAFLSVIEEGLSAETYDISAIKDEAYDRILRLIRRNTGKEPMVLPLIIEIA